MSFLTATELADLRSLQETSLTETATIKTDALVADPGGGHTESETTVATESCRVASMDLARAESQFGGRFQDAIPYEIALPHDSVVEEEHRIEVDSDTYEVVAVWKAGTYGTTTKAICMKVT